MCQQHEYRKGDRVRIVQGTPAAPQGIEATVIQIYRDSSDTIAALDILITADPAQTHGTRVFPREVELIREEGR